MHDHQYLVFAAAMVLMVTNLLGAAFTIRRVYSRREYVEIRRAELRTLLQEIVAAHRDGSASRRLPRLAYGAQQASLKVQIAVFEWIISGEIVSREAKAEPQPKSKPK